MSPETKAHLNASIQMLAHTHGPDILAWLAANLHAADAGRGMAHARLAAWLADLRSPRRRAAALEAGRLAAALRSLFIATIGQVRITGDIGNPDALRAAVTLHPDGVLALEGALEIAALLDARQVVADFEAYRDCVMAAACRLSRQAAGDALR